MSTPTKFPLDVEIVARGVEDGYEWVAARAPMYGAVNGYVYAPNPHPWAEREDLWDIPNNVPWGEITFHRDDWYGFDTLHAGQYWEGGPPHFWDGELMTEEKVIGYCKQLARDAASAIYNGTYQI